MPVNRDWVAVPTADKRIFWGRCGWLQAFDERHPFGLAAVDVRHRVATKFLCFVELIHIAYDPVRHRRNRVVHRRHLGELRLVRESVGADHRIDGVHRRDRIARPATELITAHPHIVVHVRPAAGEPLHDGEGLIADRPSPEVRLFAGRRSAAPRLKATLIFRPQSRLAEEDLAVLSMLLEVRGAVLAVARVDCG